MTKNITPIDRPRCSRCGAFKPDNELNGYNPLAPVGQKYKQAYCKRAAECNSQKANDLLDQVEKNL